MNYFFYIFLDVALNMIIYQKKKETVEESNKVELKGMVCPTNGEILEL